MRATTICLAAIVLLGICPAMLADGIPGGIVFSDGKEISYYDLQTKEKKSLFADLKKEDSKKAIYGPAAVSENGNVLAWIENGRLWVRKLPYGKPYLAPSRSNIKGIPGDDMMSGGVTRLTRVWENIPDIIPGIPKNFCLSADGQMLAYEIRADIVAYDPHARTRQGQADYMVIQPVSGYATTSVGPIILGFPDSKAYGSLTGGKQIQARTACAPAWSRYGAKLALIHKAGTSWEPIEVRSDLNIDPTAKSKEEIGFHAAQETKCSPASGCQSIAWKSDDTVTYLSDGTLYSEKGAVIAKGIQGCKVYWLTDSAFTFQGKDNSCYLWNNGTAQKISDLPPGTFSYCHRDPFGPEEKLAKKIDPSTEKEQGGQIQSENGGPNNGGRASPTRSTVAIGNFEVEWIASHSPVGKVVYINVGRLRGQDQFDFAIAPVSSIGEIQDPTKYEYQKVFLEMLPTEKTSLTVRETGKPGDLTIPNSAMVRLSLNQILLLRMGDRYAAIQPVSIESKTTQTTPIFTVTYEWKYWPAQTQAGNLASTPPKNTTP